MIPKDQIHDVILAADIRDTVESCGFRLRKAGGALYKCSCPFHDEKDASFMVDTGRNRYRCYGCGKYGNSIDFLMELKNLTFPEAVKELAARHGIAISERTQTPEEQKAAEHRQRQEKINRAAMEYFEQQLRASKEALAYARSRFSDETIANFHIGYAPPGWQDLYTHLREKGYKFDALEESDLFRKTKDDRPFSFFRDRLMFPIFSLSGMCIAFSGRALHPGDDTPKYLNSNESALYSKGRTLFGLNLAYRHIRDNDSALLVEGNADVVKMHQIGVPTTTAACGTALTDEQIRLIGRVTRNFVLMLDSDSAGRAATMKNGKRITEAGYNAYVLEIPPTTDADGNERKQDPDSYFTSKEQFEELSKSGRKPFLQKWAEDERPECLGDPARKSKFVQEVAAILRNHTEQDREAIIASLSRTIPPKTLWRQAMKSQSAKQEQAKQATREISLAKSAEQEETIKKYGFYVEHNCYLFYSLKSGNFFKGSNFTLEPLFHIESTINAKRLYRLTNEHGVTKVLELAQKDLISIAAFRLRVESLGNFLFEGGDAGLGKVKAYLYENTKTCKEITQLGWQKPGFFAWGNGIIAGRKFVPVNELGIVTFKGQYYYLPAFSSFYEADDSLFQFERRFINNEGAITLFDLADRMQQVYGDNAIAGLAFYFSTLFRDIISSHLRSFPILNIFGPKGTGKSEMAVTLLQLFGDLSIGPNLTNTTVPALCDHVAQTRNALCHIDEYKNSVDFVKIEFLKGLWDGVGRRRMNMEKDRKNEMTSVEAGIILTGQEMATADNALFSRVLFLSFTRTSFDEEAKSKYSELKRIEKQGLTHITNSLLEERATIGEKFADCYKAAHAELSGLIANPNTEDRILKNWATLLAVLKIMMERHTLPFTYEKAAKNFAELIDRQNRDVIAGNEVSDFWSTYQALFSSGMLEKEFDFQIKQLTEFRTPDFTIERPVKVLYVNPNRIFSLYAQTKKANNEKKLPKDSLKYYLKNSQEFLGIIQKRFRHNIKNLQDKDAATYYPGDGTTAVEYERPYAWCFDYELLAKNTELNLETEFVWKPRDEAQPKSDDDPPPPPKLPPPRDGGERELPF